MQLEWFLLKFVFKGRLGFIKVHSRFVSENAFCGIVLFLRIRLRRDLLLKAVTKILVVRTRNIVK